MLFNSIEYALFLPIVFLLYWFVFDYALKNCKYQLRLQNLFLLVASYVFYGWWSWRFLILIAVTSFCSWGSGLLIARTKQDGTKTACEDVSSNGGGVSSQPYKANRHHRLGLSPRFWLWANILLNLGILGVYKYYDFFVTELSRLLGLQYEGLLLHLVLPVGISFYTFQALSYSIDVYQGKIQPTKDIIAFFAFLSFFPQLVAGPIERATNLLPQILEKRRFDYNQAVDGMRQILWGLFKKIVIADNCATYVNEVFGSMQTQSGSTLLLAAVLFTFQIYGDFSGYSDIAIGTAKLFGIRLMRNFNVPYFSRDIAEFWRRWHISLTTWFRDYIYIPLGGSRPEIPANVKHKEAYKKAVIVRNTFIIFLVSGLWHGANWTFVLWGAYHAILFLPLILLGKNRKYMDSPTLKDFPRILVTFLLVVFGWIIFRATGMKTLTAWITGIFSPSLFSIPWLMNRAYYIPLAISIAIMLVVEWRNRKEEHGLYILPKVKILRYIIYIILSVICMMSMLQAIDEPSQFIYFQF